MFLENQINRGWRVIGFIKLMENRRAEVKRRVGEDFILAFRQFHFEKILFDNLDVLALADVFMEQFGRIMIWLYGDYLFATATERGGNHARAGSDIENCITFLDVAMAD